MITNLKPYPAMKDSGVPWLGEVPEHWRIARLKSAVSNVIDQTTERRSSDLYVALEHVESWTGRLRPAHLDVVFDSQVKRFRPGDVLFSKLRPYLAKVTRPIGAGVCVGEFLVLRPRASDDCAPYIELLLRSRALIDAVNGSTFGAKMPRADWQFVGAMPITLPPLPEQAAIVRFLDDADRRIRRYIRAKQKLIKLLEEQKQAIIHRAVTRGLDPNVRRKPSGVEWLGDVPEHWEVLPLKRWVSTKITDGPHETPDWLDDGVPFLSAEVMVSGRLDFRRRRGFISRDLHDAYCRKCRPQRDDIFMCKSGATTGKVAIVETDDEFSVWSPLALIRVRHLRVLPRLMFAVLQCRYVQRQVQDTWSYGTQPNLSMGAMERLMVALPPIDEQGGVLAHIDEATRLPAEAIQRAHHEIALLREYRTRLTADVVTGKLSVLDAAARLLDEAGELEPLDETEGENDADEADADSAPGEAEA